MQENTVNYQAPLREFDFVLNHLADLPSVCTLPGYEACTVELVGSILDEAARFAEQVLAPLNRPGDQGARWEQGVVHAPAGFREAWQRYVQDGWLGLRAPLEYGGQGLPALVALAAEEMWCAANLAFSLAPMLTLGAIEAIARHASPDIRQCYLPAMIRGTWSGTMNLTESGAGSDLAQIRTRAEARDDGSYRIVGQKIFITWGEHDLTENIIHLVLARLPGAPEGVKGLSLFLVPKYRVNPDGSLGERNDVHCVSLEHKLGIHGSPTAVMCFGDGPGAYGLLVGEAHQGLDCMFTMMNHARLDVGVEGLAMSQRAYQAAVQYARNRVQGRAIDAAGKGSVAIIRHPDVRRMLMQMKVQIEAQRALACYAATAMDRAGRHPHPQERCINQALLDYLIPVVKGWCTEQAGEITSLALQVHGGCGYIEDTGVAQYFRDARITSIYEGTTGIQALDLIGRKTVQDQGKVAHSLLSMVLETARQLDSAELPDIALRLRQGVLEASRCVAYILEHHSARPAWSAAGAVPFLCLMGIVLGGWQLARAALIARRMLAECDQDQRALLDSRLISARFFAEHLLPQTSSLANAILNGASSTLDLDDACF
jgi:alkylation response protein AidB-like acyl-CoA dehydrogenase